MKRSLKRLLRRQARKQTKEAIRALEQAAEDGQSDGKTGAESNVGVDARARTTETDVTPDSGLKEALQSMDDYDFEQFVADLWERMGWETEVSTQSNDRGIDVVATRNSPYEEKALIQAKRYGPNTTVGSPDIQQYASLKHQRHGVDKVLVVTTNGFSGQARELAHQLNVKLVDGDDLAGLVEGLDATGLVERYVPAIREPEPEPGPGVEPNPEPESDSEAEAEVESRTSTPSFGSPDESIEAGSIGETTADRGSTAKAGTAAREDEGPLDSRLPGERWQWVAATTALWPIAAMLGGADGGLSMLIAWAGLPYAILKDGTWTRWRRWYAVAALLPGFAMFVGGWYLLMRWRAVGLE
ncbi:restriction endonuclease [Halalkalicoccus tibetensis]|uniref:Restriction endonuclease n=1 Tax=Halalkalicoccus tibetensis TaxID=175632 RepID=A0ABD5V424_9EURY